MKFSILGHTQTGIPIEDFVSEANTIFCTAIKDFSKNKNTKFSTYFHKAIENRFKTFKNKEFRHRKMFVNKSHDEIAEIIDRQKSIQNVMELKRQHQNRLNRLDEDQRKLIEVWLVQKSYDATAKEIDSNKYKVRRDLLSIFKLLRNLEPI